MRAGGRPSRRGALALALALAAGLGAAAAAVPAAAQELVYFWERGCPYCEAWDADIGSMYHKTWEGARFPLRREALGDGIPDDLEIDRSVQYTPTFVLVDDAGREVGRVTGYNPEWFWAFLDQQIRDHDAALRAAGQTPPSPSPCARPGAC